MFPSSAAPGGAVERVYVGRRRRVHGHRQNVPRTDDVHPGMTSFAVAGLPRPARLATVEPSTRGKDRRMPAGGFDVRAAYAAHGHDLLGFAVNALRDRGLAEECVQETFTRAWRARERFDAARASERTWLFAIARNVVVDAARARARRPVQPVPDVGEHAQPATDPAGGAARVDDHVTLVWALAQLREEHRRVVVAVRLEGLDYAELSRHDGVPVATLRTRMFHALRALRAILDEEDR